MNKRKTFLFAVLAILVLASGVAGAQFQLSPWEKDALSKTHIIVDGQEVPIYYGGPKYYITDANEFGRKYPLFIDVKDNVKNKFIGIKDKVYKAEFSSSAPDIASIDENGIITFWEEGDVIFTVTLGDSSALIPLQVFEGPFIIDMLEDILLEDVVERLGFPDKRTSVYIKWPDRSAVLDNIFYSFGGTNDITVEHWHYDEYPTLYFRIFRNSFLRGVNNAGWDCGYESSVRYNLGIPLF